MRINCFVHLNFLPAAIWKSPPEFVDLADRFFSIKTFSLISFSHAPRPKWGSFADFIFLTMTFIRRWDPELLWINKSFSILGCVRFYRLWWKCRCFYFSSRYPPDWRLRRNALEIGFFVQLFPVVSFKCASLSFPLLPSSLQRETWLYHISKSQIL